MKTKRPYHFHLMRTKQEQAISIIDAKMSNWDGTFEMVSEYPHLKKDLTYIRDLLQDKYFRKLKLAECHMYYTMTKMYDRPLGIPAELAYDLEAIDKAIQAVGKELVHEAAIESACLLDTYGEADDQLEEKDLVIMQDCVTRLENYIDSYFPEEKK